MLKIIFYLIFIFYLNKIYISNFTNNNWKQFQSFQLNFTKIYQSKEELNEKYIIFACNINKINIHNLNKNKNYKLNVNKFTDTYKLSNITHNTYKSKENTVCKSIQFTNYLNNDNNSFDWRIKGKINPIKDQGLCGSCLAFSSVSNAEHIWYLYSGELFDLSEQELIDCVKENNGCNGGKMESSFKYLINMGLCLEKDYKYLYLFGNNNISSYCKNCKSYVSFMNCFYILPGNQLTLKYVLNKNPVIASVDASSFYFRFYSSGILDEINCGTNINHAVEIIGYGNENGIDFWIVRNSWGTDWGENGYIRIKRTNLQNDIGICGIASNLYFLNINNF
jgi:C1A family cysteine protease